MKKLFLLIPIFVLVFAVKTKAQNTPVIDAREENQRARIREGAASGQITHAEASHLRSEERHIRRTERRAKSDGIVTPGERTRIGHKQNRASRDIKRQKHDSQTRVK